MYCIFFICKFCVLFSASPIFFLSGSIPVICDTFCDNGIAVFPQPDPISIKVSDDFNSAIFIISETNSVVLSKVSRPSETAILFFTYTLSILFQS